LWSSVIVSHFILARSRTTDPGIRREGTTSLPSEQFADPGAAANC
jgi:hypothetical protein